MLDAESPTPSCSQRLGDLVAELPEVEEEAAVALLGGAGGGQGPA